ncbi:hypothetical protein [Corynebacterium kalidii]|uniref:Uncharacterized protein n=1 Tax=Corynebacterium kalidii TaxID=2931982 RepID=A0A9X2B1R2_9CORY|nr:hypothetical protein [Corynebacterium kalidii]MCJ7857970.1 hypothetical protein [Corynebacterium kalidii]
MTKRRYVHALVTHPLIAALITVVLSLVSVVGLALPWARMAVSAAPGGSGDADMFFTLSGFGTMVSTFEAVGLQESRIEPAFLSTGVVLLFLALASAVLIAFTALRRIAALVVAGSGAGLAAYAVYGLVTGMGLEKRMFSGDASGMGEQEAALVQRLLDALTTSTGPGEYVVLVAGVLLLLLGGYLAVRAGYPWLPATGTTTPGTGRTTHEEPR